MYTEPFRLAAGSSPDARFSLEDRTHRRALAYLGHALAQGEGFVVVTDAAGTNGSPLVNRLLDGIDHARLNAVTIGPCRSDGDDLLRLTARGLGIAGGVADGASLLEAIEDRLEGEFRCGRRTLLVVEEAQDLPVAALEELRMLSNFRIAGRALVQILLLGRPALSEMLAAKGLEEMRQRIIATLRLDSMGAGEGTRAGSPAARTTTGFDASNGEKVLPFRASRNIPAGVGEETPDRLEPYLERLAALEGRVEEQEAALRRVLTLLVEWMENRAV